MYFSRIFKIAGQNKTKFAFYLLRIAQCAFTVTSRQDGRIFTFRFQRLMNVLKFYIWNNKDFPLCNNRFKTVSKDIFVNSIYQLFPDKQYISTNFHKHYTLTMKYKRVRKAMFNC